MASRSKWRNWKVVIGLTGGMGSGKSTVLKMFKDTGARTLDADEIVHGAYKDKSVRAKVAMLFGRTVVKRSKELDKQEISKIIFLSPVKRKKLEAILHPIVRKTMASTLRKSHGRVAVCDVPLLFEKRLQNLYDKTVVVNASLALRLKRLEKRGIAPSEAKNRMKHQWPLSKKVQKADFVINNNESLRKTKHQVEKIWKSLQNAVAI